MNKTKTAVDIFNKAAKTYQEKFMDVGLYADSLDLFCDALKNNTEVLELACGPGNITKYLLDRKPDLKILATDLAPNMLELAKINNPQANCLLMDCRDLLRLNRTFDAIMCGFCLPYLSREDAVKLICDAEKILKPGGVIYLSTMEDDYSKSGPKAGSSGEEMYMHYHEEVYLRKALEENNFKVVLLQRKVYSSPSGEETTDLIIVAGK